MKYRRREPSIPCPDPRPTVNSSDVAYSVLREAALAYPAQEAFVAIALDARLRPIGGPWLVALGSLAGVDVHPRDVFREAILRSASVVVVAHNHPSGDPDPSPEDRSLTGRLRDAGEAVGVPVVDHLVITSEAYASFADLEMI